MHNHILCLAALACLALPVSARDKDRADMDHILQQIDEAMERSPYYVSRRQEEIDANRKSYGKATDDEQRLMLAEQLFWLYKPYKNDSALHYAADCIKLAQKTNYPAMTNRYRALMARQCSNAGMYVESLNLLQQTQKEQLDRQGLTDYYNTYMHVCGEIAVYTLLDSVRDHYYALQDHYRDSLFMTAEEGSDDYLHLQIATLIARGQYEEALKTSDLWLNKVQEGSHEDAYAAYYRHIVYDKLGNKEQTRYWLAKSALDDIKCAVMDQASLITLAQLLNEDGDTERSYRYIRFTWKCNSFFNTRIRTSQISPVLSVIEKNYQESMEQNTRILTLSTVGGSLLTLLLLVLFYLVRKQKRRLDKAQEELKSKNEELKVSNEKLQWMNKRMLKHNKELFEINHRLQEDRHKPANGQP